MATKKEFLAKVRGDEKPRKTVNPALEELMTKMMEDARGADCPFEQRRDTVKLALALEGLRNKIVDDDWGKGFMGEENE